MNTGATAPNQEQQHMVRLDVSDATTVRLTRVRELKKLPGKKATSILEIKIFTKHMENQFIQQQETLTIFVRSDGKVPVFTNDVKTYDLKTWNGEE